MFFWTYLIFFDNGLSQRLVYFFSDSSSFFSEFCFFWQKTSKKAIKTAFYMSRRTFWVYSFLNFLYIFWQLFFWKTCLHFTCFLTSSFSKKYMRFWRILLVQRNNWEKLVFVYKKVFSNYFWPLFNSFCHFSLIIFKTIIRTVIGVSREQIFEGEMFLKKSFFFRNSSKLIFRSKNFQNSCKKLAPILSKLFTSSDERFQKKMRNFLGFFSDIDGNFFQLAN